MPYCGMGVSDTMNAPRLVPVLCLLLVATPFAASASEAPDVRITGLQVVEGARPMGAMEVRVHVDNVGGPTPAGSYLHAYVLQGGSVRELGIHAFSLPVGGSGVVAFPWDTTGQAGTARLVVRASVGGDAAPDDNRAEAVVDLILAGVAPSADLLNQKASSSRYPGDWHEVGWSYTGSGRLTLRAIAVWPHGYDVRVALGTSQPPYANACGPIAWLPCARLP